MVLLVFGAAQQNQVAGVLVDASDGGFRVRHPFSGFRQTDVVRFLHPLAEGTARVVWTRAVALEFETGFVYLSAAASD